MAKKIKKINKKLSDGSFESYNLGADSVNIDMANGRSLEETVLDLENRIDKKTDAWFLSGVPTADNEPAIDWADEGIKKNHIGDIYYDIDTWDAYRWVYYQGKYQWILVLDDTATEALERAEEANEKIDNLEIGGTNLVSNMPNNWEQGTCNSAHSVGATLEEVKYVSTTRIRPVNLISINKTPITVSIGDGYYVSLIFFDAEQRYLGKDNGFYTWFTGAQTIDKPDAYYVYPNVKKADDSTITASDIVNTKLKLEYGNKPTDWSPAPEDKQDIYGSAGYHNSIYRGKDLTNIYTIDELSEKVRAGDWSDLYIGDYITVTINGEEVDWVIGAFNYEFNKGDQICYTPHLLLVMRHSFETYRTMNAESTTSGGYMGSAMWTNLIPTYTDAIKAAFGASHVLKHREVLTRDEKGDSSTTSYIWANVEVNIMNENMVYGGKVFSSNGYDAGECNTQLPLFAFSPDFIPGKRGKYGARYSFWLRSVANTLSFCAVGSCGNAEHRHANEIACVRLYFLFY